MNTTAANPQRYTLRPALPQEAAAFVEQLHKRVRWMDQRGVRQWNSPGYLSLYNLEYFTRQAQLGRLYLLTGEQDGRVAGGCVLLERDEERWEDASPALYIHNLVGDPDLPGTGGEILAQCEAMARSMGKEFLRLDCMANSLPLNQYYQNRGFELAGSFVVEDGAYAGNRRQKKLS